MARNELHSKNQTPLSVGDGLYGLAKPDDRPNPQEGRRLMLAFMNIRRRALREVIIKTVTELSRRDSGGAVTFIEQF